MIQLLGSQLRSSNAIQSEVRDDIRPVAVRIGEGIPDDLSGTTRKAGYLRFEARNGGNKNSGLCGNIRWDLS